MLGVESLDRLEQADHRDLFEIFVGDASVPVPTGEVVRDTYVTLDERVAKRAITRAAELEEVRVERTRRVPPP